MQMHLHHELTALSSVCITCMISVILKGSSIKAYAPAGRSSVQCPVRCGVALGVGSNGSHPLSEVIGAEGTNQAG